jgi:peroxiredoxin
MKRRIQGGRSGLIWMVGLLILMGCATAPAEVPVAQPGPSESPPPAMVLPVPADRVQQNYLGLDTTGNFALADIQAQVLLIEVFSMYCPHCQREAPNVNRLYRRIIDDPSLASRVKMIGIGVGNTTYEVDLYRKTFEIPFPLFPDRSRHLARQLEIRETPTFVGFAFAPDGTLRRILHVSGPIGDVEEFLTRLLELAYLENRPA